MISLKPLIPYMETKPDDFSGLWFRKVGGAAEYARLRLEALPLPALWIVRSADSSQHAGERAENVGVAFDAVIAIENVRSMDTGEIDDLLLQYRLAVKSRLLGWEIQPGVRPIKFNGGRVIEYTDGDLYWADRYSFEALVTNYLPDPAANFGGLTNTGGSIL